MRATSAIAHGTASIRTQAIQISVERRRSSSRLFGIVSLEARERPLRVLAQQRVTVLGVRPHRGDEPRVARVPGRHEGVAAQVTGVVAREVEAVVATCELLVRRFEPGGERYDRLGAGRRLGSRSALLHSPVPRAHVLADVAPVDLRPQLLAVLLRNRLGRLRPVREAAGRVDHARLVEGTGRARLDAERAGAAVELERPVRLDLDVGHEGPQDDPGAEAARDQQRVLTVEADAGAGGALAIDVLVRVDQDAVLSSQSPSELSQLLPKLAVAIGPRVARKPPLVAPGRGPRGEVTERRRDDGAS